MSWDKRQVVMKATGNAFRPGPTAALASAALALFGSVAATPVGAAPQIPALKWEKRSDWVNVRTDLTPAAVGELLDYRILAAAQHGSATQAERMTLSGPARALDGPLYYARLPGRIARDPISLRVGIPAQA